MSKIGEITHIRPQVHELRKHAANLVELCRITLQEGDNAKPWDASELRVRLAMPRDLWKATIQQFMMLQVGKATRNLDQAWYR